MVSAAPIRNLSVAKGCSAVSRRCLIACGLLAVALYFFLATRVAAAHGKFNVALPSTAGNSDFERVFRAHVNMLEWMPTFLVWLCVLIPKAPVERGKVALIRVLFGHYDRGTKLPLPHCDADLVRANRQGSRVGTELHEMLGPDALIVEDEPRPRSHLHWASHDEAAESTDTPRFLGPSRIPPPMARPLKILRILT
jgi:hypothetical protein